LLALTKNYVLGSIEGGYYDRYYYDFDILSPPIFNDSKKNAQNDIPSYHTNILKSAVAQSITYHLGGPVTQPSTMFHLRREATVHCRYNSTLYRNNFVTCNVTECLFNIQDDPCETRNIVDQYPRVRKYSTLNLIAGTSCRSGSFKSINV